VRNLTDDQLIAQTKEQLQKTKTSHGDFRRDMAGLLICGQEIVDRFKDQYTAEEKRLGKPTVREAFALVGQITYDLFRCWKSRYGYNVFPDHVKPLKLTDGEEVKVKGTDKVGVVDHVHVTNSKADVKYPDGKVVTEFLADLVKVKVKRTVRKVKVGDRFMFEDGKEYEYVGGGKFDLAKTLLKQKKQRAEAKRQVAKADLDATTTEEEKMANAEAARNAIDQIAVEKKTKKKVVHHCACGAETKRYLNCGRKRIYVCSDACMEKYVTPTPASHRLGCTNIGDKSVPTQHGFYWEFRKNPTVPYTVRDVNHPDLGILCECTSKTAANAMLHTYETDAAAADAQAAAYPISTRINHAANDDEACSAPVEVAQIQNRLFL